MSSSCCCLPFARSYQSFAPVTVDVPAPSTVPSLRMRSVGNLHVHVREVFRSDELCSQRDGVNAGAWIQFDDAGDIRARYNERTEWIGNEPFDADNQTVGEQQQDGDVQLVKEIVVLIGARGLTLRLSDDGNNVTDVIARPAISLEELMQLEMAGVLNSRVLRGAVLQAEPVVIAEVAPTDVAVIDLDQLGRRYDNRDWQPSVTTGAVHALPAGANNQTTIRVNLPLSKVLAINKLAQRTWLRDVRTVNVNDESSPTHIFGWFNPDDRAIRVFEGPELNMTLFSLNKNCDIVESITVGDAPFFAIGRLEELRIVPNGLRDRLISTKRL